MDFYLYFFFVEIYVFIQNLFICCLISFILSFYFLYFGYVQ